METEIIKLGCKCGAQLKVEATILPGYSDHEMVKCPLCGENIKEIRADMGFKILEGFKPKQSK